MISQRTTHLPIACIDMNPSALRDFLQISPPLVSDSQPPNLLFAYPPVLLLPRREDPYQGEGQNKQQYFLQTKGNHTMKKSIIKRLISVLCMVALFVSMSSIFSVSASAASVKKTYDCDKSVTFTVKTGTKTPSIKFGCDAAPKTMAHRCNKAPVMAVSVSPSINGKDFFLIKGTGKTISSTLKLLQKNTTYTIKISYYVNKTNECTCFDLAYVNIHDLGTSTTYRGFNGRDIYVNGSWYFSKITNCTVSNIKVK